ncbi:hypothetical protein DACRYDRAFT_52841 [Dacryopinax primogenitus]|uniref:Uncharacterized protein n=1 Tax=Dacryopinax primogenitus (strain DJM 731) TaxID=1858805 RepID=M5FYC9_DACPD|nr:uncharacterized protein DACRYDRAFT_52841 [Dacryopinax primogenitus]EJU01534.1 hypothetical protein DACRYDRAFT_52841 [Dacryopinax primogenitus]
MIQGQLPHGATLVPVILAMDKTQLTQFSGNRQGYPVYLMISNLPKEIKKLISMQSWMLIGLLPMDLFDKMGLSDEAAKCLFHFCKTQLIQEIKSTGMEGVEMVSADGLVRLCFPILRGYIGNYPENCLASCMAYSSCPIGNIGRHDMGRYGWYPPQYLVS